MPKKRKSRKKAKKVPLIRILGLEDLQVDSLELLSCFWDLSRNDQRKLERMWVLEGVHPFMEQWYRQEELRENFLS